MLITIYYLVALCHTIKRIMTLYIIEIITQLTIIGTICYLMEKFVIEKENECNNSKQK